MNFKRYFFLLYFFLFFVFGFSLQAQNENATLKSILIDIENQHQISFNYLENDIATITLVAPIASFSLSEKINYLRQQTQLDFENTANGFFSISKPKKETNFTICGFVFNKNDKSPLENTNILIENGTTTTTDSKGYFELNTNKKVTITISYIGFSSKKIIADIAQKKDCLQIYLEPESNDLIEVIANRYLTTGITRTTEGTLILKPKKLGILPGLIEADVLQAMQQIPGISSSDESVSSINVRGGTNDQNLFLWNGIKMYQTGHFFGLISAFNPNLAHTISISKNGSSAFYGESVSSVIDINSNTSKIEKNTISAGLNLINADVYSKFNVNSKGFIELAGRKSITEFLQSPTYKEYFDKAFQNTAITNLSGKNNINYSNENKFGFYDVSLKYHQTIGQKNLLIFDFLTINDKLEVMQKTSSESSFQSEKNNLIQKNNGANVSYIRNWNPKNKSKIALYASTYTLNADKTKIETRQNLIQENSILDTGLRLENNYILNKKTLLNSGYQYNETGITNLDQVNNPLFLRQIKEVLRSHALIMEGKLNDTINKLTLNIGLRSNYFEKLKKVLFEPRVQFNYGIARNWNLEILSELKSQTTFQIIDLQNDYFGIEKRRWILANDSIIPIQRSAQTSVNFTFKKNNWLISIENFYKKVSGINSSGQGFQNQLEFKKINGSYSVFGTEILIQKKIKSFLGWISYSYNDNKYTFLDLEPSVFSNNYNIKHTINWAAIYEKKNLKIAIGSKWNSGKPITTPRNNIIQIGSDLLPKIDYNNPNNGQLGKFFQINFSTTYQWKDQKKALYKLGFSVLNILNTKNEINEYFRVNTTTNTIEDIKTFALERTPNLSFRVVF